MIEKECSGCKTIKPLEQFYIARKKSVAGRQAWCKGCAAKAQKAHRMKHPGRAYQVTRKSILKNRFGMTEAHYAVKLAAQGFACAICKKPASAEAKRLAIDHCHTSGKVRGLLCVKCNRGLGLFNDDAARLVAAAAYVLG